jgi:two-component system response regulator MprA
MSRTLRVLVVEDDHAIRRTICDALELEGYEVRTAGDGGEALRVLGGWRPGAIILDLMMPRVDGFAFRRAQLSRAELRDIPVVVLSAVPDVAERSRELRPAAALAKPFDLDVLLDTVARVASAS